ncbi:apiosidase-like domain-containing protein [Vibrio mediterranei]
MQILTVKDKVLVSEDGSPFFYTACTAWELFHKLTFSEAKKYLKNRASKGFNVIQAVVISELDGLHTPDYETGSVPFDNLTSKTPNHTYMQHVKNVVKFANSIGLYIAIVPMWGSHIIINEQWGGNAKPEFDIDSATLFMDYLANLLNSCDVIWMLGGDRSYLTQAHCAIVEAMACTIRSINNKQLITVHTQGGRSVIDMFDNPTWMDFASWQTGHMGEAYPSWYPISHDYQAYDKPILDVEPCYEAHPIMNEFTFSRKDGASRFTAQHIRRSSYWSVFAGGCGITYGCYSLWQMRRPEDDNKHVPESAATAYGNDTIPYWFEVLDYPGAFQIGILKQFIESLEDVNNRVPANGILIGDNPTDENHIRVMKHRGGKWLAAYNPNGRKMILDISQFGTKGFTISWFNPQYGITNSLGDDISESLILNITPPNNDDWILVLKEKP